MAEKKLRYAVRFDLQSFSKQTIVTSVNTAQGMRDAQYTLISLPLYAAELLSVFTAFNETI